MIRTLETEGVPPDLLPEGLLWLGYRGSVAHGTYVPHSDPQGIDDIDLMGVFVAPESHYLGVNRSKQTIERVRDQWDIVHYEVIHFISLLLKQNPNVISALWLPQDLVLVGGRQWSLLRENRKAFASKDAYNSFTGYAYSQLQKMTRLQENGPEIRKRLSDLEREIDYRERRKPHNPAYQNPELRDMSLQVLRTKRNDLKGQKGYMGEKRKQLTEAHGYDTKNAAHLIRLLRMGIEFLETGRLSVKRDDAEELIAIKRGEWSLYAIEQLASTMFERAKEARDRSVLPDAPDWELANKLCIEIVRMGLERTSVA